jgi:outer membrane usher protein FimD/PapC
MKSHTALIALAAIALAGCTGAMDKDADAAEASVAVAPAAPSIVLIEMGKQSATSTLRVSEAASEFRARDTVFVSVVTANAASDSRLSARWMFQDGVMVDSSAQDVARGAGSAESVTQFRVMKDKGWAVGTYSVDVWLNDMLVGTKQFTVKR